MVSLTPAENGRLVRRGYLYRPLKQPVTIRLDADVLTWFKMQKVAIRPRSTVSFANM